jgi:hypothetical protein
VKDIIIIVLTNNEHIICQYDEDYDSGRFVLYNSYLITGKDKVQLTEFPRYSSDGSCVIYRENILTTVENPNPKILQIYLSKVGDKLQKRETSNDRTILTPIIRDDVLTDDYWEDNVSYIEEE